MFFGVHTSINVSLYFHHCTYIFLIVFINFYTGKTKRNKNEQKLSVPYLDCSFQGEHDTYTSTVQSNRKSPDAIFPLFPNLKYPWWKTKSGYFASFWGIHVWIFKTVILAKQLSQPSRRNIQWSCDLQSLQVNLKFRFVSEAKKKKS